MSLLDMVSRDYISFSGSETLDVLARGGQGLGVILGSRGTGVVRGYRYCDLTSVGLLLTLVVFRP